MIDPTSPQFAPSADVLALTGYGQAQRWNTSAPVGTPVVVTYSFNTSLAFYDTADGRTGFRAFSASQQDAARQALDVWGRAAGIDFVEVASSTGGQIRFNLVDMSRSQDGYAYFPFYETTIVAGQVLNQPTFDDLGGDVFLNTSYYSGNTSLAPGTEGFTVLLHEIGHAIGFKHPFEGTPRITASHDDATYTVMSYNWPTFQTQLGSVDVDAVRYYYGGSELSHGSSGAPGGVLTWNGSGGNDWMLGSDLQDQLYGSGGADTLLGYVGDDLLFGDVGADLMVGGRGNDTYQVDNIGDVVWEVAGEGTDTVRVYLPRYVLPDAIENAAVASYITLNGGSNVTGNAAANQLSGDGGADTLDGAGGNDTIAGGAGADALNGGSGIDTLDYGYTLGFRSFMTIDITVNLAAVVAGGLAALTARDLAGAIDTLSGFEAVSGGGGNDMVFGSASGETVAGFDGNDTFVGGDGADVMAGGTGADAFDGGTGFDTALWGGARAGFQIRSFEQGGRFYTVVADIAGGEGTDALVDVETLGFSGGNLAFGLAGIQQNRTANIDGGAQDDVLLQNATTGAVYWRDMQAGGAAGGFGAVLSALPAGWRVFDSADITGDGRAEVLIQDGSNGSTYALNLANWTPSWSAITTSVNSSLKAVAAGDITGDGTPDVLYRQDDGFLYAADLEAGGAFGRWILVGNLGQDWRTVGLGDFNRDGASDVLFQEIATGFTVYRDVANGSWGYVAGGLGTTWIARATGDMNGDGFEDVVFRNAGNGDVLYVSMLGGSGFGNPWGVVATGIGGTEVRGTADVDNDGYDDVLIQTLADGSTRWRDMNAGQAAGWGTVTGAIGADWMVV